MLIYYNGPYEGEVSLSKEALMHLKARRAKLSELIYLCDGKGLVATTKLVEMSSKQAICEVIEVNQHETRSLPRLVLGIPKVSTLEFILQKATEIGVSEIILLKCEYTPIAFNQTLFDKKKERWEKIIISACEQAEIYHKPKLSWMTYSDYIATDSAKCMLHPYAEISSIDKNADIMVGPEGGWSDAELSQDIKTVKLDTGILRVDTACIAALLSFKLT